MSPQATLSKAYNHWPLVVDEQELRRLTDACQRALAKDGVDLATVGLQFQVTFSDGLSVTTDSIDAVVGEENPRSRSIVGVDVAADIRSASVTCKIGAGKNRETSIAVVGSDRQWVYVTFSRIEERLRHMKPWHPRAEIIRIGTFVVGCSLLLTIWSAATKRYPQLLEWVADGKTVTTGLGTLVALSGITLILAAIGILPVLFPNLVFRIGDGVVRHDRIKSARAKLGWGLFLAGVLTPLVRIVSGLFW